MDLSSYFPLKRGRYIIKMRLNVIHYKRNVCYISNTLIKEFIIVSQEPKMKPDDRSFKCDIDFSIMEAFTFYVGKEDDDDDDSDDDDDDDDDDDEDDDNTNYDPFDEYEADLNYDSD